jgi:hypothetical protein
MSKCSCCGKKIDTEWETGFEWYGLDGDVIHTKCKKIQSEKIDKINKMEDNEFNSYILGGK